MQEETVRSNGIAPHRTVYNVDTLLNAFSSLDEEQQEIGEKKNWMIVPSVECLLSDSTIFNDFPLPIGFIFQPFVALPRGCLRKEQSPIRCDCCEAISSNLSKVESNGNWKCAFCETINASPEYVDKNKSVDLKSVYPEWNSETTTVEYQTMASDVNALYSPVSETRALLFLIDKSLSASHFVHLRESLDFFLNDTSFSDLYVGLIVFGDVIEIYELEGRVGEADVYSGSHLPSASVHSHYIHND